MATIKSYTDISQSKKLAEILPIESADMYYQYVLPKSDKIKHNPEIGNPINALEWYNKGYVFSGKEPITIDEFCIPCWSLAALLDIIKTYSSRLEITLRADKNYNIFAVSGDFVFRSFDECSEGYNNLIDACYALILKLNELNLL